MLVGGGRGWLFHRICGSSMSTSKRRKLTTTASDAKSQPFESASGVTKSLAFEGMRALILESGIGKARTNLFKSKVLQLGGAISECLGAAGDACRPTHLIVDDSMTADRLMRIIKIVDASDLSDIEVVRSAWLSECIRSQHMIGTDCYGVVGFTGNVQGTTTSKPPLDSNAKQPSAPAMTRSVSNTASDEIGKQNKRDATVSNIDHSESGSDYQPSCSEDEDDKCEDKTCKDVCTKVLPVRLHCHSNSLNLMIQNLILAVEMPKDRSLLAHIYVYF